MVHRVARRAVKFRPSLLVEWRSPRVWIEALETRRVLNATLIPADVPEGYFRYWGAGSNPADRDPELAVPYLEGQDTFKGTLATFWGDAPEASRVYWRLDVTTDVVLDSEGEWVPDELTGAPYNHSGLPWQRAEVVDVPGPTFEVRGNVNLPEINGKHYSTIALVDDFGGGSYACPGPSFFTGDPNTLLNSEHNSRHAMINVVSEALTYVNLPQIEDRYQKDGDVYHVSIDWQDGAVPKVYSITTSIDPLGYDYQSGIELDFDATRYKTAFITVTRADGRASMKLKGDISDYRPTPVPASPPPTEPAPKPTTTLPTDVYDIFGIGLGTLRYRLPYPASLATLGEFAFQRTPLTDDTTIEACFYRTSNWDAYYDGSPEERQIVARFPVTREKLGDNHYRLSIPEYDLELGVNRYFLKLTRGTELAELSGRFITTYRRGMTFDGNSPFVDEGELTKGVVVAGIVDVAGHAVEDYAATMTLADGTNVPLKVTISDDWGALVRLNFSADLTLWAFGERLDARYDWELERKDFTVTVSRAGETVTGVLQVRINSSVWIHPRDLKDLKLPPAFWLEEPQTIIDPDGKVQIRLRLHDELDGRLPLPQVKFTYEKYYRNGDWEDDLEASATIVKTPEGYEAVADIQFGDEEWQSYSASVQIGGEQISSVSGTVFVYPPIGTSSVYLNWSEPRFLAAAEIDFGEIGYAFAAAYLGNFDASVGLAEYSVEVTCSDGSPMRGYVSQNTEVWGNDIVVMVQPHVATPGVKTVYITVRYRDQVATFTSSMDVWPRSGLPEVLPEWETGSSYPYNIDEWDWDIERTAKQALPLPAAPLSTLPSISSDVETVIDVAEPEQSDDPEVVAISWALPELEIADWRANSGMSMLVSENDGLLADESEILA